MPHADRRCSVLLISVCLTAAALWQPGSSSTNWLPTEVSPTILLLGEFDWKPYQAGGSTSRCTSMVDRAVKFGSSRLNFVPTHYYKESSSAAVTSYCYMDSSYNTCNPFDEAGIASFQAGLSLCLTHAAAAGVTSISIVPHLDSASSGKTWTIQAWRNGIVFGPLSKRSGYSYEDIMLNPVAQALGSSLPPSTRIYFSLQGEMGATVFRYPKDYQTLLSTMRSKVEAIRQQVQQATGSRADQHKVVVSSGPAPGEIKMGATFNFIFIDGDQAPNNEAAQYDAFGLFGPVLSFFLGPFIGMRGAPADTPSFDQAAVKSLFTNLDFIGISAYSPLQVDFTEDQLQDSAFSFFKEAKNAVGIDLSDFVLKNGIEIHYVEYGLGGGIADSGGSPATTVEQVAAKPYWGVFGPYSHSKDPWSKSDLRTFLEGFWTKSLEWLQNVKEGCRGEGQREEVGS